VDEQQKQTILDLPKVIAVGIASPIATVLTSRFGIAGTLLGLALSAVLLTVLVDVLKVYLARAPGTVAKMPGSFRAGISWQNVRVKLEAVLDSFSALAPARRRSILVGSVVAGVISFFVGLSVVTGVELGVGKSLSCWVWSECPTESSIDGDKSQARAPCRRSSGAVEARVTVPRRSSPWLLLSSSLLPRPRGHLRRLGRTSLDQKRRPISACLASSGARPENRSGASPENRNGTSLKNRRGARLKDQKSASQKTNNKRKIGREKSNSYKTSGSTARMANQETGILPVPLHSTLFVFALIVSGGRTTSSTKGLRFPSPAF
jgi:hypothetical protein